MSDFMNPFEFRTVPAYRLEWGGAGRLGELLGSQFSARNALIVTDAGLRREGLLNSVERSLREFGFTFSIFDQVIADPPENIVLACVELLHEKKCDIVIGIGGGSSLDVAKLAAILAGSDQKLADIYGIGNVKAARKIPLVQVPTTAGTGSEVTPISIITTGGTTKMGVVAPQLYADFALLDAELTIGLPPVHTAATGIDAMVHAIEAYTSLHLKNPISDALAREALRLLGANLVRACRNGTDRAAREAMLLGAMLAGQSFANSPVGAVHALAYPLGGHYHVPHGLSNALMLGPVLRFNSAKAAPLYAELAEVVFGPQSGSVEQCSQAFVDGMEKLMNDSGAPRRLRDVGVKEESLGMLAKDAMLQTRLLRNNPVNVNENDALRLYREAF